MPPEHPMKYWERAVPWAFGGENLSYREKRKMRYALQDYMLQDMGFERFPGKSVLEVGSGGGIDSAEFANHGALVACVDFTETGARTTNAILKEAGHLPRVVRASAIGLPFKDSSFDCVYSFGVLHHIPEVNQALKEMVRVLKSGGELICMLYNKDSLLYAYSILFLHRNEGSEDEIVRKYSERTLDCPYTKAFTKGEVENWLRPHFSQVDVKVRFTAIDLPKQRKVKVGLDDSYGLGWHLLIHAVGR